jgi:hypothetical protein
LQLDAAAADWKPDAVAADWRVDVAATAAGTRPAATAVETVYCSDGGGDRVLQRRWGSWSAAMGERGLQPRRRRPCTSAPAAAATVYWVEDGGSQ